MMDGDCSNCNRAPGTDHRLRMAERDGDETTVAMTLCEPCANEILATHWIEQLPEESVASE